MSFIEQSEFPEIEIRQIDYALDHQLHDSTEMLTIVGDSSGMHINNAAVAREIVAATRRILEAHKAKLLAELAAEQATEQAATERAHA